MIGLGHTQKKSGIYLPLVTGFAHTVELNMKIQRFKFIVELYFNPPPGGDIGVEWRGREVHTELMYASNAEVAARAIKQWVNKRIGSQRCRLSYLNISAPELVADH